MRSASASPGHRQKGRHATHKKQTTAPRLGTPPGRHQQAPTALPAREATRGAVKHHDQKPAGKTEDDKPPPAPSQEPSLGWTLWLALGGLAGAFFFARKLTRRS